MRNRHPLAVALVAPLVFCISARADEVRDYEENGVTYRETRRVVNEPVTDVQCVEQQRTVGFREQLNVQMCDQTRSYIVPMTEYRVESYWRGRFNPFVQPYLAQRLVPYTRYETRVETVKTPVATRQLLPITSTVKVPVTTQRVVQREIISRVAISGTPAQPAASPTSDPFIQPSAIASRPMQFGGLKRHDTTEKWGAPRSAVGGAPQPIIASRPNGAAATAK
ncbi:MAG TPA: hypothetical protein VHB99_13350 [Pirellulales bacterium]|nr:hypothetical protein [Pirellulales bacterium]